MSLLLMVRAMSAKLNSNEDKIMKQIFFVVLFVTLIVTAGYAQGQGCVVCPDGGPTPCCPNDPD